MGRMLLVRISLFGGMREDEKLMGSRGQISCYVPEI
jgi:hypothetical protein